MTATWDMSVGSLVRCGGRLPAQPNGNVTMADSVTKGGIQTQPFAILDIVQVPPLASARISGGMAMKR